MYEGIIGRIKSSATTVSTTATAIPATALTGRRSIVVQNTGANDIYLGASDVTTSNGYPLSAGESLSLDLDGAVILYGIVAAGTETVRIIEGV